MVGSVSFLLTQSRVCFAGEIFTTSIGVTPGALVYLYFLAVPVRDPGSTVIVRDPIVRTSESAAGLNALPALRSAL